MRKGRRIRFMVVKMGYRQIWRLTLIVFLLSFGATTIWQLAVPPQYAAQSLLAVSSQRSASAAPVKWHWSELLVQGFPWLRSASPRAFLTPLDNLKNLAGACFGFIPGNATQTVMAGLPWLKAVDSDAAPLPEANQEEVNPAWSTLPQQEEVAAAGDTPVSDMGSDASNTVSGVATGFSLLPVFSEQELLALPGDLLPQASQPATPEATVPEDAPVRTSDKAPVLIFHTHNAEAYQGSGDPRYVYNNDSRTVVYIGDVLAEKLRALGVPVVHEQTHHMDANFNLAYVQARRSLQKQLETSEFSMILDLHNDGTNSEITTCEIGGTSLARLLLVIGTAEGIGTSWRLNESFASAIHQGLQQSAPGLSRGLYYEPGVRYNQDIHPASLIIEVGGNENSLDEALGSIEYLAQILADLYFNGW